MRCFEVTLLMLVAVFALYINALLEADGAIRRYFPKPRFSVSDIPSQKDRVAIITGANVGLGRETAVQLARKGAHVVLACRSSCESIAESIRAEGGNALAMSLDLSDSRSIAAFANEYRATKLPIHMLILNAGVMTLPQFTRTKDGLEMQLGVNWIGHFYLQHLLQDIVEASAPSRIIILSSKGHQLVPKTLPDVFPVIDTEQARAQYSPVTNYGYSKLANIYHALELDARMKKQGKKVSVLAVHPGAVDTELARYMVDFIRSYVGDTLVDTAMGFANLAFTLTVHEGALTQLWAATSPEIDTRQLSGSYAVPIARIVEPSNHAKDVETRKRVWAFAEDLIKRFPKPISS